MGPGRILANLIMAVIISLAMLLVITSRNVREQEVAPEFFSLAVRDDPVAVYSIRVSDTLGLSREGPLSGAKPLWDVMKNPAAGGQPAWARVLFERHPPHWIMLTAVAWHRADVVSWWWLPLIVLGARVLVGLFSRRRR